MGKYPLERGSMQPRGVMLVVIFFFFFLNPLDFCVLLADGGFITAGFLMEWTNSESALNVFLCCLDLGIL